MKDAYDNLFRKYNKQQFFLDGLHDIIYIENDKVINNWENIVRRITNNQELFIRGYGRDAANTNCFFTLYKHLFDNENIKKDPTNNAKPTQLISELTGMNKNLQTDINGQERIQNYQISHLFGRTKNPLLFTAAWNIAYIPKYIDPFTGHETQGEYKNDFQSLFIKQNKEKFSSFINEYNSFININVLPKLELSLKMTKKELKLNEKIFRKFEKDVLTELSNI